VPREQPIDPDAARRAASHILSGRRFQHDPAPRPLRKPLEWLGKRLQSVGDFLGRVLGHVPTLVWLALGALIIGAIVARALVVAQERRVSGASSRRRHRGFTDPVEDPDALEREADEAARAGDFERALRLRFRAGLLRLGERGAIEYRPSVTTNEVRRELESQTFDDLADTFEAVAYGGEAAQQPDADTARREWPHVVEEANRK